MVLYIVIFPNLSNSSLSNARGLDFLLYLST